MIESILYLEGLGERVRGASAKYAFIMYCIVKFDA
jgi:hypothetical protein